MFRVAGAILAVLVVAMTASAVRGQAQTPASRFQLTAEGEGFLRLDTQTGALSYCSLSDGRWVCVPAEMAEPGGEDIAALAGRLTELEQEIANLVETLSNRADNTIPDLAAEIADRLDELEVGIAALPLPDTTELAAGLATLAAETARLAEAQAGLIDMVVAEAAENPPIGAALEALGDRQAALEFAIQELAEAQADAAFPAVAVDLLDRLEAQMAELRSAQAALREAIADIPVLFGDYAAVEAEMAARLAAMETAVAMLVSATAERPEEMLSALAGRIDALAEQLARIEPAVATDQIRARLDEIAARQAALETALAEPPEPAALAAIEAAIIALSDRVALLAEIAGAGATPGDPDPEGLIGDLRAQLDEIEQSIAVLIARDLGGELGVILSGIGGQLAGLGLAVEALVLAEVETNDDAALNEIVTRLDEIAARQEAIADDVANVRAPTPIVAALNESIGALGVEIGEILAAATEMTGADIAELDRHQTAVAAEIGRMAAAFGDRLDEIAAGPDAIVEAMAALEAELRKIATGPDDPPIEPIMAGLAEQIAAIDAGIAMLATRMGDPEATALLGGLAATQQSILNSLQALADQIEQSPAPDREPIAAAPAIGDEPGAEAEESPNFGEQMMLRLFEMVGGLKRGFGG